MKSFPTIRTVTELAMAIGITVERLGAILADKHRFYRHVAIPKGKSSVRGKSGNVKKSPYPLHPTSQKRRQVRHLHVPLGDLMDIQRWLLGFILYVPPVSDQSTAYVPGRNQLTNVQPHAHHRYFLCLDIHDFFGSITTSTVEELFISFGYDEEVSRVLAELCTHLGHLPQGAPSSPAISNLVMRSFDAGAVALCKRESVVYTRYADDLTFSADARPTLTRLLPQLDRLLQQEGFLINWRKYHVTGPRRRCEITGLVRDVTDKRFGIGRRQKRMMRAIMMVACQNEVQGECSKTLREIEGWLAYAKGVDRKSYEQMSKYWQRLTDKHCSNVAQKENGQPVDKPKPVEGCKK